MTASATRALLARLKRVESAFQSDVHKPTQATIEALRATNVELDYLIPIRDALAVLMGQVTSLAMPRFREGSDLNRVGLTRSLKAVFGQLGRMSEFDVFVAGLGSRASDMKEPWEYGMRVLTARLLVQIDKQVAVARIRDDPWQKGLALRLFSEKPLLMLGRKGVGVFWSVPTAASAWFLRCLYGMVNLERDDAWQQMGELP